MSQCMHFFCSSRFHVPKAAKPI